MNNLNVGTLDTIRFSTLERPESQHPTGSKSCRDTWRRKGRGLSIFATPRHARARTQQRSAAWPGAAARAAGPWVARSRISLGQGTDTCICDRWESRPRFKPTAETTCQTARLFHHARKPRKSGKEQQRRGADDTQWTFHRPPCHNSEAREHHR